MENTLPFLQSEYLAKPARKHEGLTKIAHISDLHFKKSTVFDKDGNLIALKNDLVEKKPDIIIVTGDLADNGPQRIKYLRRGILSEVLENVKAFLIELCNLSEIDPRYGLFVVPGNHDYRFWGWLPNRANRKVFDSVFGEYLVSRPIPSLGILICAFDSNVENRYSLNVSSGYISEKEIHSFFAEQFNKWRDDKRADGETPTIPGFERLVKLAVLHHHPMPIAETQGRDLTRREELLLLKNAGVFMKEMARNGIDIILHGHRHYPGYSRAGFPIVDQNTMRYIGVLAAGSAGVSNAFYSYNVLTIFEDGMIEADYRERTKGAFVPRLSRLALLSRDEIRHNTRLGMSTALENQEYGRTSADRLSYSLKVCESGDLDLEIKHIGWRSRTEDPIASIPHFFHSTKGADTLEVRFRDLADRHISWKRASDLDENEEKIRGDIVFNPPLQRFPINAIMEASIVNRFLFDKRDSMKMKAIEHDEFSMFIEDHVKELSVCIQFPESLKPERIRIEVWDDRDGKSRNDGETGYCSQLLNYNENVRVITLSLSNPIPGHTYRIAWDLPERNESDTLKKPYDKRIFQTIVKRLSAPEYRASVETMLCALRDSIVESDAFKETRKSSKFETSLMLFDEDERVLRLIAVAPCTEGEYPDSHSIWKQTFRCGEGIPGQVLRRRESILFDPFEDGGLAGRTPHRKTELCPEAENDAYTLIYSIPILYPQDGGAMIGVMSFGTCLTLCGLTDILREKAGLGAVHDLAIDHFFLSFEDIVE